MNEKKFSNRCLFLKAKGKTKTNHEVLGLWQRSLRLHDVIDFWRNWPLISSGSWITKMFFVANRYSSISCIKDQSIATCADVTRLLLMFEKLRLTLAKKRCEWECNKTIISENFCVFFLFLKTSGYHLKVFVFKLNQIHICQTTIVERHLRHSELTAWANWNNDKSWPILQEDKKW